MFERFQVELSQFARSLEVVGDHLDGMGNGLHLYEEKSAFLIATLSLPEGQYPPWDLGRLELDGPEFSLEQRDDERVFVNERRNIFIINSPAPGEWHAKFSAVNDEIYSSSTALHLANGTLNFPL